MVEGSANARPVTARRSAPDGSVHRSKSLPSGSGWIATFVVLAIVVLVLVVLALVTAVGRPRLGGGPLAPVMVGLAVGGGTDRPAAIERLTTEVRSAVELLADSAPVDDPAVSTGVDDELGDLNGTTDVDEVIDELTAATDLADECDDEVGDLAAAVDDLTSVVAERTDRERSLRRTTEWLEAIVEASPDALVAVDLEDTVQLWNPAAERIFGWRAEEVLGEPLPTVPADAADEFDRFLDELRGGGIVTGVELERRTKSGDLVDVRLSKAPIRNADGEIVGLMGVLEDVTERKDRERRLEATTARLEALFERSPDMIEVLDTDGRLVEANRRFCDELGYDAAELAGTGIWEYERAFDEADVQGFLGEMDLGERRRFEGRFQRRDGSTFPIEVNLIRLDLADDDRFVGISRDVTERAAHERELQRYREYTADILDAIDDVVYVVDEDYEFQWWNESFTAVTGHSDAEIADTNALEFVAEDDRKTIRAGLDRIDELRGVPQEADVVTKDGTTIPFEFVASPLEDPDGERVIAGVARDISERRKRERELERYREYTDDVINAIDDLFYVLDADGSLLRWNESLSEATGYADEAIGEMNALTVFAEEDRSRIAEAVETVFETGEARAAATLLTADGERIPYEFVATRLEGPEGERIATGIGRDVSERRKRERELERYETIVQALGELVYVIDEDGVFRFLNDALTPITGFEPDELIGEHVSTVMRDADLAVSREFIRELLLADEPSRTFEMDLLTKGGDVIDAENHMALLPMPDGEFAGTAGVVRDVTERKERERELERTRALLERVQQMAGVGGWERDLRVEPPESVLTAELYRRFDLPRGADVGLEDLVGRFHPDDRPRVREHFRRTTSDDRSNEFEARIRTDDGDVRWVRAAREPIRNENGEAVAVRGTVQDITDRKEREFALESLHETARSLLGAETPEAVADLVVETADEVVDAAGVALYRLDPSVNRLAPIARTDGFDDLSTGTPSIAPGDDDSVLWNAFVTGAQTVVDDPSAFDRSTVFDASVPSAVVVPVGDYGVLTVASGPDPVDADARRLIETLVATTEAAFDRLENEAALRERDAELEARNRRLRRQIAVTETIRRINGSLIGATTRAEIERTVPEQLVETEDVAFAWIGTEDASGSTIEPRAWAGESESYLDVVSLDAGSMEPACRTVREGTTTVVGNVVADLQAESWRKRALDAGFQSAISVPLAFEEYAYGVLTVYATEPDAFADLERSVFTELGETIASAINATKTREALHAETLVELTLALPESADVLSRIAVRSGAGVAYEGLGTRSGDDSLLFFETRGASPEAVDAVLADLVSVSEYRMLSHEGETCRFEALVTGPVVASRLVRHGASPRSIRADGDETVVTADVPVGTDVREFVDLLAEHYGDVELRGRHHVERAMHTRREVVTALFDALTDRQLEVLRTAYFAGYFEWPRESTGEDIAEILAVSQPTVNRHLRVAQQRLLAALLEEDAPAPVPE